VGSDHFAALEKYFKPQPTRLEGDLSDADLAEHFKCSKETVRAKMKAAMLEGTWEQVWVIDKERGRIKVYRKVNQFGDLEEKKDKPGAQKPGHSEGGGEEND